MTGSSQGLTFLGFATLVVSGCVTTEVTSRPPSLVVAYWDEVAKNLPQGAECEEPDVICMNAYAIVRFERTRTLGGPAIPLNFKAAVWYHSVPLPTTRLLLLVERKANGAWEARRLGYLPQGKHVACIEKEDVAGMKLKVSTIPSKENNEICLRV